MEWGDTTTVASLVVAIVGVALWLMRAKKPDKPKKPEKPEQLEERPQNHSGAPVSLLFIAGPRYRLMEIEPQALSAGFVLDLEGRTYTVARLGPAPLPSDGRRCAYVEPTARRSADS
jgi:hypothetical protein